MAYLDESLNQKIDELATEIHEQLVGYRQTLHQHPELAFKEIETTRHLATMAAELGLAANRENFETGFIVDLNETSPSDPVICLRADIDAIDNQDEKNVPYASWIPGVMHGCGHDVHSTMLLGALSILKTLAASEDGTGCSPRVRGIFQPAEENARGAEYMIERGVLAGANAIFALHVDPRLDCGQIAMAKGKITAICDELSIVIDGKSGHAARPFETIDPIQASALLLNALYVNVPRSVDARHGVVISFGQIEGGNAGNVIPNQVNLAGTIRCHHEDERERAIESIKRTCRGIGQATGAKIRPKFGKLLPAVNNSPRLLPIAQLASELSVGKPNVSEIELPSLGGEDFAYYQQHIEGFMLRIGSSSPEIGHPPLHSSLFDVHPDTIKIGAAVLAKCALMASSVKP